MAKTKDKRKRDYFLWSLKYLRPYKGWMFICLLSCAVAAVLAFMFPIFTQKMLAAFAQEKGKVLLISAGLLLLLQVLRSVVHILLWGTTADKLRARLNKDIRHNIVSSIFQLRTKNFDLYGSGKLIQVVASDTAALSGLYTNIVDVSMCILENIAVFVYIFTANYILGFYCLLEFVVVCLVYHIRIRSRIRGQIKLKQVNDKSIGLVNETIRGVRDIKNYNIQSAMLNKVDESLTDLEKTDAKLGSKQYRLRRVTQIVQNLMAFLFIPLALLLIHFNLTTFAAAFTIFVFRNSTSNVIEWIMSSWEYTKDGGVYAERIYQVIYGFHEGFEEFPAQDAFAALPANLDIVIKDLSFAYDDSLTVLKKFNLNIPFGTTVAIVGESGEGKSTILKLLNKTYDVPRGHIFIGGQDLSDFSQATLRDIITIVPQDPYVFNFSILDNLKIVKPNASSRQIQQACQQAQIHDFIMAQPDGYETVLGENGTKLSGGQKQRLAIARAFLKDSPILIFDETTSALDNENQNKMKEAISNIGHNKTVIIVAHRLSTIVDTDVIHVMKNGMIAASGTHKQLLATCPEYRKLYQHES